MKALLKLPFKAIAGCLIIAAMAVCVSSASGTVLVRLGLDDLVKASTFIVEGFVVDVDRTSTTPNGGIETRVEIRVVSQWKGPKAVQLLTLKLPGGEREETIHRVAGVPGFIPGEAVVLFLEPVAGGWIPTGLGQGVFRLGTRGEEKTISQAPGEGMYLDATQQGQWHETSAPLPTLEVPYRQFRREVEQLLGVELESNPLSGDPVILP